MTHICLVCGYPGLAEPPRRRRGVGSYEICPSCGFQFGVSDDDEGHTFAGWRQNWKNAGMKWSSHGIPKPRGWNPEKQLANLDRAETRSQSAAANS